MLVLPVLLFFNPFAIASDTNDPKSKRVLVIYSYHEGIPWERIIHDSLHATLASKSTEPIELNVEHPTSNVEHRIMMSLRSAI